MKLNWEGGEGEGSADRQGDDSIAIGAINGLLLNGREHDKLKARLLCNFRIFYTLISKNLLLIPTDLLFMPSSLPDSMQPSANERAAADGAAIIG